MFSSNGIYCVGFRRLNPTYYLLSVILNAVKNLCLVNLHETTFRQQTPFSFDPPLNPIHHLLQIVTHRLIML